MTPPNRAEINLDTPLRLAIAAEIAFPGGGMTAAGLRREAARGRLTIERVAGKDYVTLAEIGAMRERCRRSVSPQGFGSGRPGGTRRPSGSSKTETDEIALAAALRTVERLTSGDQPGVRLRKPSG